MSQAPRLGFLIGPSQVWVWKSGFFYRPQPGLGVEIGLFFICPSQVGTPKPAWGLSKKPDFHTRARRGPIKKARFPHPNLAGPIKKARFQRPNLAGTYKKTLFDTTQPDLVSGSGQILRWKLPDFWVWKSWLFYRPRPDFGVEFGPFWYSPARFRCGNCRISGVEIGLFHTKSHKYFTHKSGWAVVKRPGPTPKSGWAVWQKSVKVWSRIFWKGSGSFGCWHRAFSVGPTASSVCKAHFFYTAWLGVCVCVWVSKSLMIPSKSGWAVTKKPDSHTQKNPYFQKSWFGCANQAFLFRPSRISDGFWLATQNFKNQRNYK